MMTTRPLPDVHEPLTAPFWEAARESRLSVQRCEACSALRWQPSPICPECLTPGGTWVTLSGEGEVWSYAVYHRAMNPAFAESIPYTVAMVELREGPRMVGEISPGAGPVQVGQPVHAVFEELSPGITVVRWTPSEGHAR